MIEIRLLIEMHKLNTQNSTSFLGNLRLCDIFYSFGIEDLEEFVECLCNIYRFDQDLKDRNHY